MKPFITLALCLVWLGAIAQADTVYVKIDTLRPVLKPTWFDTGQVNAQVIGVSGSIPVYKGTITGNLVFPNNGEPDRLVTPHGDVAILRDTMPAILMCIDTSGNRRAYFIDQDQHIMTLCPSVFAVKGYVVFCLCGFDVSKVNPQYLTGQKRPMRKEIVVFDYKFIH